MRVKRSGTNALPTGHDGWTRGRRRAALRAISITTLGCSAMAWRGGGDDFSPPLVGAAALNGIQAGPILCRTAVPFVGATSNAGVA